MDFGHTSSQSIVDFNHNKSYTIEPVHSLQGTPQEQVMNPSLRTTGLSSFSDESWQGFRLGDSATPQSFAGSESFPADAFLPGSPLWDDLIRSPNAKLRRKEQNRLALVLQNEQRLDGGLTMRVGNATSENGTDNA
jgi:hypothetical protein